MYYNGFDSNIGLSFHQNVPGRGWSDSLLPTLIYFSFPETISVVSIDVVLNRHFLKMYQKEKGLNYYAINLHSTI